MAGVGVESPGNPVQDARINVIRRKPFKMRRMGCFVINPRSSTIFPIHYTLVAPGFSWFVDIPFPRR
jgi:hypothetical protein